MLMSNYSLILSKTTVGQLNCHSLLQTLMALKKKKKKTYKSIQYVLLAHRSRQTLSEDPREGVK